jgi:integration host factor subunit beta
MTKSDLVEKLAEKIDYLTKKDCDILRKEDKIEIRGFGSFTIRVRKAKEGRNPKTGEKVFIPQKKIPFFKVGKELREMLNRD